MKNFKNILIRMPNWIGDFVMATPIIFDLKKRFNIPITILCKKPLDKLIEDDENIDKIITFDKKKKYYYLWDIGKKYDMGILLNLKIDKMSEDTADALALAICHSHREKKYV